ncbi:MAG: hypothetical protein ACM3ZE_26985 [Myxococcales bacterium]
MKVQYSIRGQLDGLDELSLIGKTSLTSHTSAPQCHVRVSWLRQ